MSIVALNLIALHNKKKQGEKGSLNKEKAAKESFLLVYSKFLEFG